MENARMSKVVLIAIASLILRPIAAGPLSPEVPVGAIRVIHSEYLARQAWDPFVSMDGTKIVFARLDDAAEIGQSQLCSQIWIMNPDGTEQRQLTSGNEAKEKPSLSSDNSTVLFVQGVGQLYMAQSDGTHLRPLETEYKCSGYPAWSPDDRLIAFDSVDVNTGIVIYDIEARETLQILNLPEKTKWIRPTSLCWSPDAQRLYFLFKQHVYYMQLKTADAKRLGPAEQYALSPDGKYVACLYGEEGFGSFLRGVSREAAEWLREHTSGYYLDTIDTETFRRRTVYERPEDQAQLHGPVLWSPDSSKLLWASRVFDAKSGQFTDLQNIGNFFDASGIKWLPDGRRIISEHTVVTAAMPASRSAGLRNKSIVLLRIDWNDELLSKENAAVKSQEMVRILAESLQPIRAAKLLAKTPQVPASTRVVCTEILEQIHRRMWKLAYERYPKELENVITQTDRWTYPDPLVDGANWGFLRRLKSLFPLTGDFVKLGDSYFSDDGNTLVGTENICGYSISVKHRKVSQQNAYLLSYFSENQKAKFELMIVGSKELREDVTNVLFETLKPFFALEFLFDANSIYGIDLTDSIRQIQQENTKYASQRKARRMLTAREYSLCRTGWPATKKDTKNSGFVVGDIPEIPLKLKWEKRFDGKSLFLSPVVDDLYLYLCFGNTAGSPSVYILDRKSGEIMGTIQTCTSVNTTPVVGEKCLYVSWNERIISAYEKGTWKEKWRAYLPDSHQYGVMTLADGVLGV
jgi:hypothetical protein